MFTNMIERSPDVSSTLADAATDAKVVRAACKENLSSADSRKIENLSNTVKIQVMLDSAKRVSAIKPKLTYGLGNGQFVCDTFIKYLFKKSWDESINNLYGTTSLYDHFSPEKTNAITSSANSLTVTGKSLEPGDLMFFTDVKDVCGHMGMFSRKDSTTGDIYIYDASSGYGVSERKLRPNELRSPFSYRNIYYTSPIKNQTT